MRDGDPHDRRHGGRIRSSGAAMLHAGPLAMRAQIVDLAVGGVRVSVDPIWAAVPSTGTHVRLDLRLDGSGGWLHLFGRLGRIEVHAGASTVVVQPYIVSPEFEDLVQDQLLSAIECAETPHVLLVDADPDRRERVAEAFRITGCHTIETSSPLEAIAALGESRLHPWAVVIADTDRHPRIDELRAFLGEAYPSVPLIVIDDRGRSATSLSVDRIPDLAAQVYDLVGSRRPVWASRPTIAGRVS